MIIDPGHANPAADALNGVYEKHRQMHPGDKVLDLGAHAGYFTSVALEKIGPTGFVVAFEPYPDNYRRWQERIQAPNAICINAGAWSCGGEGDLWPAIDNSGGHSFFHVAQGQEPKPIKCRLIDIGRWLELVGFAPDFVKIDTELAEAHILTSLMRTSLRPEIAAEIHNLEMWNECTTLLRASGYHTTPDTFENYYCYAWQ